MEYENQQMNQTSKSSRNLFLLLLIVIVLIAAGWFVYMNLSGRMPVATNPLPEGYAFTNKGMFPEGFPRDAIYKEKSSLWQRSEDTLDGSGRRLRVVEFVYEDTQSTFAADLDKQVVSTGWTKADSQFSNNISINTYERAGDYLVVTISSAASVLVNMTYITSAPN